MAGESSPNDANGVPITMGATVKLIGTVTGINLFSNKFREIQVTISHPLPSSFGPAVDEANNGNVTVEGGFSGVPGYRLVLNFPPAVLVVGT